MKSGSNYIIIFQKEDEYNDSYLGIKLFEKSEAMFFLKCVKFLEENNEWFIVESLNIDYKLDDFRLVKISLDETKVLNKLFDIESSGEKVGVFPDAINDAYEFGFTEDSDLEINENSEGEDYE